MAESSWSFQSGVWLCVCIVLGGSGGSVSPIGTGVTERTCAWSERQSHSLSPTYYHVPAASIFELAELVLGSEEIRQALWGQVDNSED